MPIPDPVKGAIVGGVIAIALTVGQYYLYQKPAVEAAQEAVATANKAAADTEAARKRAEDKNAADQMKSTI
jgi:hypothetical protein